ncbi:MAG: RlmE family RNA methyltransferase [Desulfovibrio sp.]|uniref:RlmE family RNA methyltransferase n=1 Tax=Desulfovibrio sp. 7SRBS1 TaxID=3378064 RepID=UPI003B40D6BB
MKQYRDHYFKRAKQENYPARSVYKLQEINKRFHILRKDDVVLDLGATPGSWSLFAAKCVAPGGRVLAADIQSNETKFPDNVTFMQEDVFDRSAEFEAELQSWMPFDVVISDMAPKTTGIKFTDQARSVALCEEALAVAMHCLVKGGHFVVKIFEGPDSKTYSDGLRKLFDKVKYFKPKSSRDESKEIFIVALGFKGADGPAAHGQDAV